METEVQRVTTTKKSNKTVTTLLIIAGILGFILILAAVYFYMIKPATQTETVGDKTCTCYIIDPAVVAECGNPSRGFNYTQKTVKENEACPTCTTSGLDTTNLASETPQEDFVACQLQNVQDSRCKLMTITNSEGKIITGRVSPEDEIIVEATFDKKYTKPLFSLNTQPEQPDTISEDGLNIKKSFINFIDSSLDIVATATDNTGDTVNSPLCKRILYVSQQAGTRVTGLQFTTRIDEQKNKVSSAILKVSNLTDSENLSIDFSFESDVLAKLTMNKGITFDSTKGELVMIEQDLYNTLNFTNGISFSQLDEFTGTVNVTAELKEEESILGKASTSLTFKEIAGGKDPSGGEELPEEEDPLVEEEHESNFTITGTSNQTCLERVSPNNAVTFSINIKNDATSSQTIKSIKNKLPLGFIYVPNSSQINGVPVTDSQYVKSTDIGQTVELVWANENGWSISEGQTITLVFSAEVGPNALTGDNQNEIVIEPAQVPIDPNTLRAEIIVNVEQSCFPGEEPPGDIPDTGIFDSTLSRVVAGIIIFIIGWYIYSRPFGHVVAKKFIDSEVYKEAEMTSWRMFKPKKYFEEITIKRLGKKKR